MHIMQVMQHARSLLTSAVADDGGE